MATRSAFERDLWEAVCSGLAAAGARGRNFGRAEGPCPSGRLAPKVLQLMPSEESYLETARYHHLSSNTEVALAKGSKQAAEVCYSEPTGLGAPNLRQDHIPLISVRASLAASVSHTRWNRSA